MAEENSGFHAHCHCGAVTVSIGSRPGFMFDCNCDLCHKAGALWGYFPRADIAISGGTQGYARADKDKPIVRIHFCRRCGNTTHFSPIVAEETAADIFGMNMRLFAKDARHGVETRFPDGKNWDGKGPWGSWDYYRESRVDW